MTDEVTMHHATRAKLTKLQAILAAEYPALSIEAHGDEHTSKLTGLTSWHDIPHPDDEGETRQVTRVLQTKKVPELADLFAACEDLDLDPEALSVEDDATGTPSSIVPEVFRARYRETSTTGRCNGDWLAEQLATDTLDGKGKLDKPAFTAILEKNGVDMSGKWAQARFSDANGSAGRYRMNGRQVMEKLIAKVGIYTTHDGAELTPDAEWLASVRGKHAKWLAKEAKREAATQDAIKEAVEG